MRALVAPAVLLVALACAGGAASQPDGRDLYAQNCARCHGADGEGVEDRTRDSFGPSLRGVGALSADFYLRTGYMPLDDPYDDPRRSAPDFSEEEIDALVAYVASFGEGPAIPDPRPERGRLAEGLRLFTENCSGCHQVVAEGGVVIGGLAPPLDRATDVEIAEAVRIGPFLMPSFPESQLSAEEVDSIIRYIRYAKEPRDEGGWGLGHLGPVPEGLVTWLVAALALVVVATVIGGRAKR